MTIALWFDGQPPRKSNNRRVVRTGGKTRVIKSQKALAWVKQAITLTPVYAKLELGSLDRPLTVTMHIYYETRRPDLSGELVLDMMQKAGIIKDDRYVYELHLFKHFSKERPGVRVTIDYLETQ